jgi:CheY-like chemotaxis protein
MYFIIEYVDAVTGIEGEALSWEFAKTEDEATITARAHLILFKARFGAQGYRILSPGGSLLACGPGVPELDVYRSVLIEPLLKGDHDEERHRFFIRGLQAGECCGWRSSVDSETVSKRGAKGGAFRTSEPKLLKRRVSRHWHAETAAGLHARNPLPGKSLMSDRKSSRSSDRKDDVRHCQHSSTPVSRTSLEAGEDTSLAGKRVLVVEDDGLIALDIVSELRRAGCTTLGPALRLETAMTIAAARDMDAAVLDVFLEGAYSWQLAGTLKAQGVPFLFQTGFSSLLDFPAEFASVPRLEKPMRAGALKWELKAILESAL